MKYLQIAIDGPAGAGKSTIAQKLAKRLNITYIDTGSMYRALTYKVIKENINIHNKEQIINITNNVDMTISQDNIFIDGEDVTRNIRSQEVTKSVSYIAQIPEVRECLVRLQQKFATNNSVVMDGRDIGTHVLPNAAIKIFLTASIDERAHRRYNELIQKGEAVVYEDIKESIKARDKLDTERQHAPLKKAKDAIILDTTGLDVDIVVEKIIYIISQKS
ncbi:(d)CMP kinase [Natronincola ferrireducens]|uniref:Cytidylate kinase n=1 Tax=Natronincola ferrireducens TaxID=393762 RepID=A0A1G9CA91_9FIRM|nr:(d)CMP kinase [Natronincola ferrireducens]SDK48570.1 cytidylate kinase [Natronincola ferrireducens]